MLLPHHPPIGRSPVNHDGISSVHPKLIAIIGEMGTGKSMVGKLIAERYDFHFFEGDAAIPIDMKNKISRFAPLTPKDIDDFVGNHLIKELETLTGLYKTVVVSQALYRNKHRKMLQDRFEADIQFVYIRTSPLKRYMQLFSRENGILWMYYSWASDKDFELPLLKGQGQRSRDEGVEAYFIHNRGRAEELEQQFVQFPWSRHS